MFLDALPTEIDALHAIIAAQAGELAAAKAGLVAKALEVEKLRIELARLRRMQFGRSSEKIAREVAQLELALEELEAESPPEAEPEGDAGEDTGDKAQPQAPRRQRGRRPLPSHLPRHEVRVDAPGACPKCGGAMRQVSEDVIANRPSTPAVVYRYSPDRKGLHPQDHLAGFRGHLHADGYSGFGELYAPKNGSGGAVTEVACWAHVRRKFHDIHVATKAPLASEALERIGPLFDIERRIAGLTPEERRRVRQAEAKPLLDDLAAFLDAALWRVSGKSELAGAIRHARSRWPQLSRSLDDGHLEISNNAAERAIRPLALGRKNWLFAGSDEGGKRAAAVYTLTETAKLNGLDPESYLREVLERIADHPINRIGDLLPWNISAQTRQARAA